MAYSLPLNFVKVTNKKWDNKEFDVAVCCTRIVAIMSTEINQARETIKKERQSGTLINAAGTAKAKSAIFLDNGSVIASPLSVNVLMNAIRKANKIAEPNITKRMRLYEMVEPDESDDLEDLEDLEDLDDPNDESEEFFEDEDIMNEKE